MTDLLIHSMAEFAHPILACLQAADARTIVEVGAEFGGMSHHLAAHVRSAGGSLTSIDPAPKPAFLAWVADNPHVRHDQRTSLEAMPEQHGIDAWVIDGDHNYFTVSHELKILDAISRRDGKPLLVFLHDVSWPCARRDMYYAPDRIPAAHRHDYGWDVGVTLDDDGFQLDRGFRGHGQLAFARHAGGPANGVLTAIEDFVTDVRAESRDVAFALIPAVFGLGVVFAADAPWSSAVASILAPLHNNPLIARLEENRLRNYLAVIDWQDRTPAPAPCRDAESEPAATG